MESINELKGATLSVRVSGERPLQDMPHDNAEYCEGFCKVDGDETMLYHYINWHLRGEAVFVHARHILLDDGFQLSFHRSLQLRLLIDEVMLKEAIGEVIDGVRMHGTELQQAVVLYILIDAVVVVDGPGAVGRRVEEVAAEGEIGLVVIEEAQDAGHDVDVLGDGFTHAGLEELAAGIVEEDGRAETADIILVEGVVAEVRMV